MKTKKIFIPFYSEYVGTYSIDWLGGFVGLLFKKVDGSYVFVYKIKGFREIHCREFDDRKLFLRKCGSNDIVREIAGAILSGDFSELEFKFFDGLDGVNNFLSESEKDQYLIAILNCLDMNFSHKSIITDRVSDLWDELRINDLNRLRFLEDYKNGLTRKLVFKMYKSLGNAIGGHDSDEVYKHFRDYSMKGKIYLEKIECIRDIEDGINFVKLDVKNQNFGGDFDLIGLKEKDNEEYTLVIREVSKSDLNTCKYRSLMVDEKKDFLTQLIDKDTEITSVLIQGTDGEVWENTETNDVDGYRDYIEDVIYKINEYEEDEDDNEFVDKISDALDKLKEEINGDSKEILTSETHEPIVACLHYIKGYLEVLKKKNNKG